MVSSADPPADRPVAAPRRLVTRLLDRPEAPPALAAAGLIVALATQFAIVRDVGPSNVGLGFVPAVLLFGGAALATRRRRHREAMVPPFSLSVRWEIAILLGIIALAAFFRFFRFTQFPPGLWYDEAVNGTDALWIIDHSHLTVWRSSNFGHSTLFFYLLIASFKTFGYTVFAFRMVPALAGMAAVIAFYFLARWLVGPVPALVATALLAVSRYAVTFSRISWEASLQPLFEIMAVWFLVRALETRNRFYFFMAGGSLAAGIYTYLGFRFVPIVMLFFLLYIAIAERRLLMNNVPGLVIYAVSFIIVVAPLGQFAVRHQDLFMARTRDINIFKEIHQDHSYAPLKSNIESTIKMMNVAGDRNGRHNLPGAPMLDGVSAALLVLGVAVSVWSFRNWRRGAMFVWLALAVIPGALTISIENPSAIRDIGAIPPLYLLVGLAVSVLYRSFSVTRAGTALFGLAALAMIGVSAGINYHEFFDRQAHNEAVYDSFQPPATHVGQTIASHANAEDVFIADEFASSPAVAVLTRGKTYGMYQPTRDLVLPADGRGAMLILNERQIGLVPTLRRIYPHLSRNDDVDPFGRVAFTRVSIPAADIDALHDLRLTVHDGAGASGVVLWSGESAVDRQWTTSDLGPHGSATAVWEGYFWSGQAVTKAAIGAQAPGDVSIELDGRVVALGSGSARAENLVLGVGQHSIKIVAVLRGAGSTSVTYADEFAPNGEPAARLLYGTSVGDRGFQVVYYQNSDFTGETVASGRLPFAIAAGEEAGGRAIEYRGIFTVRSEGDYGFGLRGEDSAQLFVDGDLVVDNGGAHGQRDARGTAHLTAGPHVVLIQYLIGYRPDWALYWKPPDGDWTRMDGSEFDPVPSSYVPPQPVVLTQDPRWGAGKTFDGLGEPAAVATLANGAIVVGSGHTLAFIDQVGNVRRTLELDSGTEIADLAVAPSGEIVVADRGSRSVRVLDASGNLLRTIGGPFPSVAGIDVRGQVIFVASPSAGMLFSVPLAGGTPVQLDMSATGTAERARQPSDIAVSAGGVAYVADFERARIVISNDLKTARSVNGITGVGAQVPHMALYKNVLLVTDPTGGRIVMYDLRGRQRGVFTFPPSHDGTHPVGIAATADGHVYVASVTGDVYAFVIAVPPDLPQ